MGEELTDGDAFVLFVEEVVGDLKKEKSVFWVKGVVAAVEEGFCCAFIGVDIFGLFSLEFI